MVAYVFDSSTLIDLFTNFYESRFPTLWSSFYQMIAEGRMVSVREVFQEITGSRQTDRLSTWAKDHRDIFQQPTEAETSFITEIFAVQHFQAMISQKSLLKGSPVADPFVIAKARHIGGCVVAQEDFKPNAARIPNVCHHFGIECTDLEGFMEKENWIF